MICKGTFYLTDAVECTTEQEAAFSMGNTLIEAPYAMIVGEKSNCLNPIEKQLEDSFESILMSDRLNGLISA